MSKITSSSADCQTFPTLFELEPVAGKKVTVDFTAPELSSLGGLTLVREYERFSSRIIERIESCIKDPRWELFDIGEAFIDDFIASYDSEPDSIIIDADDTNADTYGAQQLTLFNAYYGEYCYMPLLLFEGRSGKLILPIFECCLQAYREAFTRKSVWLQENPGQSDGY